MSACLLDCLREAQLEHYFPSFVRHGVTNCEHLVGLSMPDYPRYGVTTMDNRVKLFKLIQIVKSVQADGIICKHDVYGGVVRRSMHQANQAQARHNLAAKEIKQEAHRVTVRPNVTTAVEQPQVKARKSLFGGPSAVEFKQSTDEPLFHCKKTLTYSDSEEEDFMVVPKAKCLAKPQDEVRRSEEVKSQECSLPKPQYSATQSVRSSGENTCVREDRNYLTNRSDIKYSQLHSQAVVPSKTTGLSSKIFDSKLTSHAQNIQVSVPTSRPNEEGVGERSSSEHSDHQGQDVNTSLQPKAMHFYVELEKPPTAVSVVQPRSTRKPAKPAAVWHEQQTLSPVKGQQELSTSLGSSVSSSAPWHSTMIQQNPPRTGILNHPDKQVNASSRCGPGQHAYFPINAQSPQSKTPTVHKILHTSGFDYGVPSSAPLNNSGNGRNNSDNICVCVRKRPLNAKEVKRGELDIVKKAGDNMVVVEEAKVTVDLSKVIHQHMFRFDRVFGEEMTNENIYKISVKPLVAQVFDRGAATCFAFGQTGAGKTYTLLGSRTTPGMYQLAGADILSMLQSSQLADLGLKLWLSYYEVYNSQLYDLLNRKKRLYVRENGRHKVCIAGLMETEVTSVKALTEVVRYGSSCRSTGASGVNPHSSRSHAILQLEVRDRRDFKVGRLSFVDLAGSERACDATSSNKHARMEGAEINQSLLALKECIRSLDQAASHTPYRQSKLTHILRESFTGNCRTVMIANIAPTQTACDNTLNTLRYADRVRELPRGFDGSQRAKPSRTPGPSSATKGKKVQTQTPHQSNPTGTLFHPSKIQYSSTPKAKVTASGDPMKVSLDLSKVAASESPISGHQVRRSRSEEEENDDLQCYPLSPRSSQDGALDTARSKSKMTGKHSRTESAESDSVFVDKVIRGKLSNKGKMYQSEGQLVSQTSRENGSKPVLQRSHSAHGTVTSAVTSPPRLRLDSAPSATSTPRSSQNSSRSEEDIIREHQEIMSQLDIVLDKAKSVMNKNTGQDTAAKSASKDTADQGHTTPARAAPNKTSMQAQETPGKAGPLNRTSSSSKDSVKSGTQSSGAESSVERLEEGDPTSKEQDACDAGPVRPNRKSSIESAREILRELRASNQPLVGRRPQDRFKGQAQKFKNASKSQPDVRDTKTEFIPIQRAQSQRGVVEVRSPVQIEPPSEKERSPKLNRPQHTGGLLNMLRAREAAQQGEPPAMPSTASRARRWHLSDPFPVGMRRAPLHPGSSNLSTSHLGDTSSRTQQEPSGSDSDRNNPSHILKSLAEIKNARKLLVANLQQQEDNAKAKPFKEMIASPSSNRIGHNVPATRGRDIPILLVKQSDMEALKTQPITSLGNTQNNNVTSVTSVPDTLTSTTKSIPEVTSARVSIPTSGTVDVVSNHRAVKASSVKPMRRSEETWAEVLKTSQESPPSYESQLHKDTDSGIATTATQQNDHSDASTLDDVADIQGADTKTGANDGQALSAVEVKTSVYVEHSGATTASGFSSSAQTARLVAGSQISDVKSSGISKPTTTISHSKISNSKKASEGVIMSSHSGPLPQSSDSLESARRPAGGLTIHKDSAFTKVAASSIEVEQIRQTALSQGYVLSDTSGSMAGSRDASLSEDKPLPEYKRSPVRTERIEVTSTDSIFSPIIAFPVTPRDNPVITVPCVTKLELAEPSTDPQNNSGSFANTSDNVSRTVEKQLQKLKQKLHENVTQPSETRNTDAPSSGCAQGDTLAPSEDCRANEPSPYDEPADFALQHPTEDQQKKVGDKRDSQSFSDASDDTTSSGSIDSGPRALFKAQNLLLVAHEEQLSATTMLCKQEMKLLMEFRQGQKDFDEYLSEVQDLLSAKLSSISLLRSQIKDFCNISKS